MDLRAATLFLALSAVTACAAEDDVAMDDLATSDTLSSAPVAPAATTPSASVEGEFLDPESASLQELMSLPGVDSTTASALVAARPIEDMREVDEVLASSLSEDQREQVYSRLWKKIDLNTATPEEIMLIPEMTERMRGEFEEYRPYTSMERFRTEIGKYVDQAEVARLEQYVEIR